MIRHVINQTKRGYTDTTIRTVDSDVFVLAVAHVHLMVNQGATQVFVHQIMRPCEYNIIESKSMLGHDKSLSTAFSGCDTTSSVFQKGKLSFWDAWDWQAKMMIRLRRLFNSVTFRYA